MFDFLRRMIVPIMLLALVGFLATIIFQWGMNITSRDQYQDATNAVVINGEDISWEQYNQVYSNLYSNESKNYDDEVPDDKVQELQQRAYNQILQEVLLNQEAKKLHVEVSDDEMYNYLRFSPPPDLQSVPYFQTNGQFDYNKYLSGLADPQMATFWNQYAPLLKNDIRKQKVQEQVVQSIFITDSEIRNEFISRNEKIKVGLVNIPDNRYGTQVSNITDEEIQAYYDAHKEEFKKDKRAVLNIVLYEKFPTENDWEITRQRLMNIYDTIQAGADFAEMATIYSQDGSAANGGDLGWFNQGQMVPEFDKQVFSMKPGEVSEPIRTQFGWHIIKLYDFKTETIDKKKVQQAHAAHILLKVTIAPETVDEYFTTLETLRELAAKNGFEKAADEMGLEINTTKPFLKNGGIGFIGPNTAAAMEFAFSKETGDISNVIDNGTAIFVAQIKEIIPPGIASFEDSKQEARTKLSYEMLSQICADTANAIYQEIENGTDISKAAKNHSAEYVESDFITRKSNLPQLGANPIAIANAFKLKDIGEVSKPVDYNRGNLIIKLLAKQPADVSLFSAQKDSLKYDMLVRKQQTVYRNWFTKLIDDSKIVNNIQFGIRQQ